MSTQHPTTVVGDMVVQHEDAAHWDALLDRSALTLRMLAMDAVEAAGSGHPGTAMALAPIGCVLFGEEMRHNPGDPAWPNRDRFVLSAGHASVLLYGALHLTGYDLSIGDLTRFRRLGSVTPGHPERGHTPGVEVTTGPLGQGIGNAVGMALAERMLAARFNRPGFDVVDHRTYAIASDGDMMEGVSSEASSLAGHLRLDRLTVVYDDNRITIEGPTDLAFSEDVGARYEAYGWHVQHLHDGWALVDLRDALARARSDDRPSLIIVRTHIAEGAPNARDRPESHGAPLGRDEARLTKERAGWDPDGAFHVPPDVARFMDRRRIGAERQQAWERVVAQYEVAWPDRADELHRVLAGELPTGWPSAPPPPSSPEATRQSGAGVLAALAAQMPELVGGAGDLGPSTSTTIPGGGSVSPGSYSGRNLHFGVREHAMGAILNGLAAHGGLRPFGATFLVFSDYMRPAIRLSALMELPVTWILTHDSVRLGEDGPTHQPIEHLASLRAIPGLAVVRPADAVETAAAWQLAIGRSGPSAIVLTRQAVPSLPRTHAFGSPERGGYRVVGGAARPDVLLVGSGSEVHVLLEAREHLERAGITSWVSSMPCVELFLDQDSDYQDRVLAPRVWRRISLEAASTLGWERIVGRSGRAIGIDGYGRSGPGEDVAALLGISVEAVVAAAHELMSNRAPARAREPMRRPVSDHPLIVEEARDGDRTR